MAIRNSKDISNETETKYSRFKQAEIKTNIEERFNTGSFNDNPYDDAIQYLKEKIDDIITETNTQTDASGSLDTKIKAIESFPGFGTSSTTALRGNTTTISTAQANAITANTAKTSMVIGTASDEAMAGNTTTISTSQANAITANTAKADGIYLHFPVIANFYGNINTEQFVPLSDGETETTNQLTRRNNFIAPCTGTIYKVFVRSNASLLSGGKGVPLTGKLTKYPIGSDAKPSTGTAVVATGAASTVNTLDFSSVSNNSFAAGDRLLVSLQAPLDADKNYYVTVVFKIDLSSLD